MPTVGEHWRVPRHTSTGGTSFRRARVPNARRWHIDESYRVLPFDARPSFQGIPLFPHERKNSSRGTRRNRGWKNFDFSSQNRGARFIHSWFKMFISSRFKGGNSIKIFRWIHWRLEYCIIEIKDRMKNKLELINRIILSRRKEKLNYSVTFFQSGLK